MYSYRESSFPLNLKVFFVFTSVSVIISLLSDISTNFPFSRGQPINARVKIKLRENWQKRERL